MGSPPEMSEELDTVWEPCGGCWGQRVIWTRTPGAGAMERRACPSCLGVGQRAVVVTGPARRDARAA
ncbi:MAG: hypothetical protein IT200_07130 [Thermoleophilia bacterium]|nr:hypothetical protein [Thermoleophilia bacterium]